MEFNLCFILDTNCTVPEETFVIDPSVNVLPSFKKIQGTMERRKVLQPSQLIQYSLLENSISRPLHIMYSVLQDFFFFLAAQHVGSQFPKFLTRDGTLALCSGSSESSHIKPPSAGHFPHSTCCQVQKHHCFLAQSVAGQGWERVSKAQWGWRETNPGTSSVLSRVPRRPAVHGSSRDPTSVLHYIWQGMPFKLHTLVSRSKSPYQEWRLAPSAWAGRRSVQRVSLLRQVGAADSLLMLG